MNLGQTERTIERFILRPVTEPSGKERNPNPDAFDRNCHTLPGFRGNNDIFVASIKALLKLVQGRSIFFLCFAKAISSPARSLACGYRHRHRHRYRHRYRHRRNCHCRCCWYCRHCHCHDRRRRFRCHRQYHQYYSCY